MAFITAETRSDLIELSVAMLKQAPSAALLEELIALSVGGGSLADAADHIAKTAAFKAEYPSFQTAEQYAAEIFDNITTGGTVTADIRTAVIELATGMLTSGSVTKAGLALAIAEYLAAPAALLNTDFADIAQSFQNRADAAEYFVVTKELGGSTDAELAAAIASVTSDAATLTAANTAADATASAEAVVAGQTFTLTTGADTKTGSAGNDNFVGLSTTLTTGDNLNGGEGSDSITLTTTLAAAGVSVVGFSTSSIETAYIGIIDGSATDDEVLTVDMLNSSPASIIVSGSTATTAADGLTLANVDSSTSVTMSATSNLDLTVNYDASYLAGTGDTATLNLTGVGATAAADSDMTFGAGIETLTVNSTSTASKIGDLVWGGAGLTVTGDANLTIQDTLAVTANTIDASAFTGKLSVVAGNATDATNLTAVDVVDLTVTGGAGDDTLNVAAADAGVELLVNAGAGNDKVTIGADLDSAATATAGDTLNGGDGTDTLITTSTIAAGLTKANTKGVSNFEILQLSDALGNDITAANVQATGLNTIVIPGGTGTLTMAAGTDNAVVIAASLTNTLTLVDTGTGTTDAISLSNAALVADDMGDAKNIVSTGYETVNINSSNKNGTETQDFGTITLTGDTGATTTTVNFSGSNKVIVQAITATVIDASGMTAAASGTTFSMGAAAVGVTSIKGSPGADTLVGDAKSTIEGGAGNDNITGGSGNDTLHGDAGNDTITTGAGSDTVKGGDGNDIIVAAGDLTAADKIDGGDGTDTLAVTSASLTALQALSISDANLFNANFTSIETLAVSNALDTTGDNFDLGYLTGIETVALAAGVNGAQVIDGFDSGDTLALTFAVTAGVTAKVNSAATGATDVLNIALTEAADTDYNTLTIANVETININVTEDTTGGNVASRTNTVGLSISQTAAAAGGSGAAQSVVITGSEDIVIDTTIAVATIDASGMSARLVTTPGLVMTGAGYTKAQTITGSSGADTLVASTKSDTISGGAGNDTITGGTGADSIDGGTGSDTFVGTGALTAANIEGAGTGTSTGVVVNLGATTLTNAGVLGAVSQNLSGGLTGVASGQVSYLFNGELGTNSATVDTLTSIENVTLADGINYVVGSDVANIIIGGTGADTIVAGNGADTVDAGTGNDTITLTETAANSAVDAVIQGDSDSTAPSAKTTADAGNFAANDTLTFGNGVDVIYGFTAGKDTIDVTTAGAAITAIGVAENALTANKTLFLSGDFVLATGVFTIKADGAGADTLIFDTADTDIMANDNAIVLVGVDSADLVAGTFV